MSLAKTFLVLCATGHQGQAVVKSLAATQHQHKILAGTRDVSSSKSIDLGKLPGVTPVKASIEDLESIATVARTYGPLDGVFLVAPPLVQGEIENCIKVANLCVEMGVRHLVYSGVDLCGLPSVPMENFEKKRPIIEHIRSLDKPDFRTTLLGPVMLMDNFNLNPKVFLPVVLNVWKLGHKRQFVASSDVGRVAATCLLEPEKYGGRDINLAGDELTPEEIAEAFEQVKGIKLPTGGKPILPPFLTVNFKWFDDHSFSADVRECRKEFGMTDFKSFLNTQYQSA